MNAQQIINIQTQYIKADRERMARRPAGKSRQAWRTDNPLAVQSFTATVRDTSLKSQPKRHLSFANNGSATDLWVWTKSGLNVTDRIDLSSSSADEQLSRYKF